MSKSFPSIQEELIALSEQKYQCPFCGKDMPPESRYCLFCGKELAGQSDLKKL